MYIFSLFYFNFSFSNGILVYGVYRDCERPPTILHGRTPKLFVDDEGINVSATYTCEPGYQLHGNAQMNCDTNTDVWQGDLPACKLGKSNIYK